jgi:hypothetical protein
VPSINEGRASDYFTQKTPENQPYIFYSPKKNFPESGIFFQKMEKARGEIGRLRD